MGAVAEKEKLEVVNNKKEKETGTISNVFVTNEYDATIAKENAEAAVELVKLKTAMKQRLAEIEAEQVQARTEADKYLEELKIQSNKEVAKTRIIIDGVKHIAVVSGLAAVLITNATFKRDIDLAMINGGYVE